MERKEIEKVYIKKINQLKKFDKAYFDDDNPIVSDSDYDQVKEEILNLEKKYSYLKNKITIKKTSKGKIKIKKKLVKNKKKIKSNIIKERFLLKIIRFQEKIKSNFKFKINFGLGKVVQSFFNKIKDSIQEYKRLSIEEKQRIKLKEFERQEKEKAKEKEEAKRIKLKEFERQKKEKEIAKRIKTDWKAE